MAVFWSANNSEAKRNYRFKVTMEPFGANNVVWWAKTVTLPSYEVSEVEHNHMDNKYYFPGRVSWSTVAMTLVDPISPDATDILNNMLEQTGYKVPATSAAANAKGFLSRKKAANLGTCKIEVLNDEGVSVETWELQNTFIQAATFGSLDYSNDDLKELELTLRYDYATCETLTGGAVRFEKSSSGAPPSGAPPTTT